MATGIICEYNPFHNGHIYHLNEVKKLVKDDEIILILSGNFTQRGNISILEKYDKAKIALKYGVDLVIELPYEFATESSDFFAKGALKLLNELKCNKLIFGSESNDIETLKELANIQLNNKEYEKIVKEELDKGINYPTAMSKALKTLSHITIDTPNDLLGLSYVKEILKNNYSIKPITIKRNTNYNSKYIEGKITSATSIRELIKNKKRFKKYVPRYSYKHLNDTIFLDDYFNYLKYKILSSNDLTIYQGVDENLKNRILKNINNSSTLDNLLNNIKTKRYTYNRLKRTLAYILLSLKKEDFNNLELEYIRVLGFDKSGKTYLNKIKKTISIPIITNYDNKYLSKELHINSILSLNKKIRNKKEFIEKEYKEKPIIR